MIKSWRSVAVWIAIVLMGAAQAALLFALPSHGTSTWMSPDETAMATAARAFAAHGDMRYVDEILTFASWVHPRSMVAQGDAMVPVGFLGLPMILGTLMHVLGEWGLVLWTPLLVISVIYPLWRFTSTWGRSSQVAAVATWLSFPTVILYANRALYGNVSVVALSLWAVWLIWERRSMPRSVIAGVMIGLALAIRPTEAIWMAVWMGVAWRMRRAPQAREHAYGVVMVVMALIPCLAAAVLAWRTYGTPFTIGYWLRDTTVLRAAVAQVASTTSPSAQVIWPFGFHPRAVWMNMTSYFFGPWLAWTLVAIAAIGVSWKDRASRWMIGAGLASVGVVALMYGQQIYQDHVGINVVSTGNSFLRYALPVVPFFVVSVAWLVRWTTQHWPKSYLAQMVIGCGVAALVLGGTWMAFDGDDEGLKMQISELSRYQSVRASTFDRVGYGAIVLSDRSDKIFFPLFRAATPIPPRTEIRAFVSGVQNLVTVYAETMNDAQLGQWRADGLTLVPLLQSGSQTLYGVGIGSATSTTL